MSEAGPARGAIFYTLISLEPVEAHSHVLSQTSLFWFFPQMEFIQLEHLMHMPRCIYSYGLYRCRRKGWRHWCEYENHMTLASMGSSSIESSNLGLQISGRKSLSVLNMHRAFSIKIEFIWKSSRENLSSSDLFSPKAQYSQGKASPNPGTRNSV